MRTHAPAPARARPLALRLAGLLALVAALLLGPGAAPASATVIHYRTGWTSAQLVYDAGPRLGWKTLPTTDEGSGWRVVDTGAYAAGEFLFSDGAGAWDHAPGWANYRAATGAPELWVKDGAITYATPEAGTIVRRDIPSTILRGTRRLWIYLPAWYARRPAQRYPVLYMHDGQNLFDPRAIWGGWAADAAVESATRSGAAADVIIVGIENTAARMTEYTPTRDPAYAEGGGADRYLDFIERELKPWIDARYRTRTDADSTGIGGSSLGGLVSLYAGLTRPRVFGRVLAMSPSLWWDSRRLIRSVTGWPAVPKVRVYLDSGGAQDGAASCRAMRDLLARKGLTLGTWLWHREEPLQQHNEVAWRDRLPRALGLLFPRGR